MKYKFGFIGAGNMGSALAAGIGSSVEKGKLALCDKDEAKASSVAEKTGAVLTDSLDVAANSEYVVIAVKPQALKATFDEIGGALKERKDRFVLVSMAAGTSIKKIKELSLADYPVIRIMPNVPCAVGAGMTLCAKSDEVTRGELDYFVSSYSACGRIDVIEERFIDAYSIVTGCGPAYAYLMIEALADGAVKCGVPRDKAYVYTAQMLYGSAELMLETGKSPAELKDSVCSPGGTTIEGVAALEKAGFRSALIDAVDASYRKTLEFNK